MRKASEFQDPSSVILSNDAGTVNNSVEFDPEFDGGHPADLDPRGAEGVDAEAIIIDFQRAVATGRACALWGPSTDAEVYGTLDPGVFALPISYAWGHEANDREWQSEQTTFGELIAKRFVAFARGPKDGHAITQGRLVSAERKKRGVIEQTMLQLDIDNGTALDDVQRQIEAAGLFAVIYTSHSHGKPQSFVDDAKMNEWLRTHGKERGDAAALIDGAREILLAAGKITATLAATISKVERGQYEDGFKFAVTHAPMDRLRVLMPLAKAFDFSAGESQDAALRAWEAAYLDVAGMLGLAVDRSCADAARLFYTPRIAREADVANYAIRIIGGRALDLETVPRIAAQKSAATNPFTAAGGRRQRGSEGEFATKNMALFLATHGKDFEIVEWLDHVGAEFIGTPGVGKATSVCPRAGEHSPPLPGGTDTGFYVENASAREGGFVARCMHDGCKGESGDDRAWYLDRLCQQYGVTDARELLAYCDSDDWPGDDAAPVVSAADVRAAIAGLNPGSAPEAVQGVVDMLGSMTADMIRSGLVDDLARQSGKSKVALRQAVTVAGRAVVAARREAATEREGAQARGDVEGAVIRSDETLTTQVGTAWRALCERETRRQSVFHSPVGGVLRLKTDTSGGKRLEVVDPPKMAHELRKRATFVQVGQHGDREGVPAFPAVVSDMLADSEPHLPEVQSVTGVPVFSRNGVLVTEPGYHPDLKRVYAPAGLVIAPVPDVPSSDDVNEARELILGELFEGFPFHDGADDDATLAAFDAARPNAEPWERRRAVGHASRANAVAHLLLPFVREMMRATPYFFFMKPTNRAGASLLAELSFTVSGGVGTPWEPAIESPEEMRKRIASKVATGDTEFSLDNADQVVQGAALAGAGTAEYWRDRRLGTNEMIEGPIRWRWTFTARNPTMSNEVARRAVFINIRPEVPDPDQRTDFKHLNVKEWTLDNRSRLVRACLVLVQNWIAKGRPTDTSIRFGAAFDAFAQVISGVLAAAEIPGFLTNRDQYIKGAVNVEHDTTTRFIAAWHETFGTAEVRIGDRDKPNRVVGGLALHGDAEPFAGGVLRMLKDSDGLAVPGMDEAFDVEDGTNRSAGTKVAHAVGKLVGAFFDIETERFCMIVSEDRKSKTKRYSLRKVKK